MWFINHIYKHIYFSVKVITWLNTENKIVKKTESNDLPTQDIDEERKQICYPCMSFFQQPCLEALFLALCHTDSTLGKYRYGFVIFFVVPECPCRTIQDIIVDAPSLICTRLICFLVKQVVVWESTEPTVFHLVIYWKGHYTAPAPHLGLKLIRVTDPCPRWSVEAAL